MQNKFSPVDPYDFNRLYNDEKYSLQGMLLNQVSMPEFLTDKDKYFEIWSDRIDSAIWTKARATIDPNQGGGDAFFAQLTNKEFMGFCQVLWNESGMKGDITGATVVRYTNAGGFPCLRFAIIAMAGERSTWSGNSGPNIKMPKLSEETEYWLTNTWILNSKRANF